MAKDAGNDLQLWISYLVERRDKLHFLKKPIEESELVAIFLKGLPAVFQQLKVFFAIPGQLPRTFDIAITTTRKFASDPAVEHELSKLKSSGISQTMFPMQAAPNNTPSTTFKNIRCNLFARTGSCRFGTKCRFTHTPTPANVNHSGTNFNNSTSSKMCTFCSRPGHVEETCFKKKLLLQQQGKPAAAFVAAPQQPQPDAEPKPQQAELDFTQFNFVFSVGAAPQSYRDHRWVLDSGATCCATFSEQDCVDIRPCSVHVTAAGTTFLVDKVGTAHVRTVDEKGRSVQLNFANTLISSKFPYKLLALQIITSKGNQVTMETNMMRITNPVSDHVLLGVKDTNTKLFFLAAHPELTTSTSLLARAYGGTKGSDTNMLWNLHLRHGHRNFFDIARQYSLSLPKDMPACTSCIMAKSHVYPHMASPGGFERATRVAEGFHTDFRGPFTVATPQGYLYLLTIIDDFTRRIFPFLVKSQTEWYDIFTKFVVRVEAEMGKANCIAWLLSDNGSVYTADQMKSFCATKGIQQRFSAPYAQWMDHTAERNMRTIGEMGLTTLIHSNLPKTAWGYAMLHAAEVINRTSDSVDINKKAQFPANYSRLEKWKNKELPGQTKGLYPFGCLCFKHVPAAVRKKLDEHATPQVYLGFDPKCRAYLLGTLYHLELSTSVEVTFVENVFPFRRVTQRDAPASLLWGTENNLSEGDGRLGMFENRDPSGINKILDHNAMKTLGVAPQMDDAVPVADIAAPAHPSLAFRDTKYSEYAPFNTIEIRSKGGRLARLLSRLQRDSTIACAQLRDGVDGAD